MEITTLFHALPHEGRNVPGRMIARETLVLWVFDANDRLATMLHLTGRREHVILPLPALSHALAVNGACSLFMAHDHPSGDPRPSRIDIDTTRRIWRLARTLGVSLQDHMIFAGRQMFSFRANGLL